LPKKKEIVGWLDGFGAKPGCVRGCTLRPRSVWRPGNEFVEDTAVQQQPSPVGIGAAAACSTVKGLDDQNQHCRPRRCRGSFDSQANASASQE